MDTTKLSIQTCKEIAHIAINDPLKESKMEKFGYLELIGRNIAEWLFIGEVNEHDFLTASLEVIYEIKSGQIDSIRALLDPNIKTIIKLDKNFHIYKHGSNGLIERHWDPERKMFFYKIYFLIES